jgi:hypothetical protein
MWRVVVVSWLASACVDWTDGTAEQAPCQARIYAFDVPVVLDEAERGCIGPLPPECGGQALDLNPNTPGTQYDCSVSDVQRYGYPDQAEQILPSCDESATNVPCWREMLDEQCSEGDHETLEVIRGVVRPPEDNHVIAYCVACLADWYR